MVSQGLDVLDEDTCRSLLGTRSFGRVGVRRVDELLVLPVFYAYVDGDVVFRTGPGAKLDAATLRTKVAFEVDDVVEGWSVLVSGHAEEVRDGKLEARFHDVLGQEWPSGERDRVVRVRAERVTGRRLRYTGTTTSPTT
jgi:nitroimidazol reductase NimA-like FMN-containing flavoprotein (pyridoxamine 5'-phosphate oxidase superfamily)